MGDTRDSPPLASLPELRRLGQDWLAVLFRPRQFFEEAIEPGDQASGLLFAMAVVFVEEATRLALAPGTIPMVVGGRLVSASLLIGLVVLLVVPVGLHLLAAVQTILLWPLVAARAGVSETVQVLAYAAAPCALAGAPVPSFRVACTAYATWLLVVGLATVHETSGRRAAIAGTIPAVVLFGYAFRGFASLAELLASWYII